MLKLIAASFLLSAPSYANFAGEWVGTLTSSGQTMALHAGISQNLDMFQNRAVRFQSESVNFIHEGDLSAPDGTIVGIDIERSQSTPIGDHSSCAYHIFLANPEDIGGKLHIRGTVQERVMRNGQCAELGDFIGKIDLEYAAPNTDVVKHGSLKYVTYADPTKAVTSELTFISYPDGGVALFALRRFQNPDDGWFTTFTSGTFNGGTLSAEGTAVTDDISNMNNSSYLVGAFENSHSEGKVYQYNRTTQVRGAEIGTYELQLGATH